MAAIELVTKVIQGLLHGVSVSPAHKDVLHRSASVAIVLLMLWQQKMPICGPTSFVESGLV